MHIGPRAGAACKRRNAERPFAPGDLCAGCSIPRQESYAAPNETASRTCLDASKPMKCRTLGLGTAILESGLRTRCIVQTRTGALGPDEALEWTLSHGGCGLDAFHCLGESTRLLFVTI